MNWSELMAESTRGVLSLSLLCVIIGTVLGILLILFTKE